MILDNNLFYLGVLQNFMLPVVWSRQLFSDVKG